MKPMVWAAAIMVVLAGPWAWAAGTAAKPAPPVPPVSFDQNVTDFDRNTALGVALSMRPGTPGEMKELQALADRGLKSAQEAAAKYPNNAEAHYLLGSWMLYAYRVREVREVAIDAQGSARTEVVPHVVQGLSEDVEPGLAALQRATVLAPGTGRYPIDYGAALFDCDRLPEAMGYLKGVWASQPTLAPGEKTEVGILLSRICEAQGRLEDAREWVYSALGVAAENAAAVQQLRQLDAAQAAAVQEQPESSEAEEEITTEPSEQSPEQGVTSQPEEEQPEEEVAPQPEAGSADQPSGETGAPGSEQEPLPQEPAQ